MSYKPEMLKKYSNEARWEHNACRFATREEAETFNHDSFRAWKSGPSADEIIDVRVVESQEPVNYALASGNLVHLQN
jgi:hypothetical protein